MKYADRKLSLSAKITL